MCYSTRVIPFRVQLRPGLPLYEQVVYAAKKAMISGQLRRGDPFPSVRTLSRELKINPNTAHKVILHLLEAGLLEARPGIGTVVVSPPEPSVADRTELLETEMEQLVVEAKKLGIELDEVTKSLASHWKRIGGQPKPPRDQTRGGKGGR